MASRKSRELAAQAWCRAKTSNRIMDTDLAEAFADILDEQRAAVANEVADEAIGLFLEYRDQHGVEDEDVARAKAALEVAEGISVELP